jgi:hypothetical protein
MQQDNIGTFAQRRLRDIGRAYPKTFGLQWSSFASQSIDPNHDMSVCREALSLTGEHTQGKVMLMLTDVSRYSAHC